MPCATQRLIFGTSRRPFGHRDDSSRWVEARFARKGCDVDIYKNGEGKMTRRVAFYSLLILSVWGFRDLSGTISRWEWARVTLLNLELPYYEQAVTVGVLLCLALNVAFAFWTFKYLNGQKPATVLIDTETELKKVSWPTWDDARHSTVIVLIFVAVCAAYLTAVEYALATIFKKII